MRPGTGHTQGQAIFLGLLTILDPLAAYAESSEGDKAADDHWSEVEEQFKSNRPQQFAKMDADNDGHISREEAQAAVAQLPPAC